MPMRRCTSCGVIEFTARRTAAGPCASRAPGTNSAAIREQRFTVRPAFWLRIGQLTGELGQIPGDAGGRFDVHDPDVVPGRMQRAVDSIKEEERRHVVYCEHLLIGLREVVL